MAITDDRRKLVHRISELWYPEYHTSGWLKAVTLEELQNRVADGLRWSTARDRQETQLSALSRYRSGEPVGLESHRKIIELFLREYLMRKVPESVGAWGLDTQEFREIDGAKAGSVVDRIVRISLEDPEARVLTRMPPNWYGDEPDAVQAVGPGSVEETVSHAELRNWFMEQLFEPSCVKFFLHTAPGGDTVRWNHRQPRVVGMDRESIAMFWLE